MKRNILILMIIMLMTALTMPGFAQSIDVVESGPNYKQFMKAVKKCDRNGNCKTERDAKMAELKRRALIRACNSEFGASAAGPCIDKLLGDWKNVEFRVKTVEETPPPPPADPCHGYNCGHGECHVSSSGKPYCTCYVGWTGPHCSVRETEVDVEEDPTEVADAGKKKKKKKRRKKRKPTPPPAPETPVSEPFKGEVTNAGETCKADACFCRGSKMVVFKGQKCPTFDPWLVTWEWKGEEGCPEGYAKASIDHSDRPWGCYAEGAPEEELGKPDSRYLCSVWEPEPRSWSEENPIAAAWLAVGLPLLLIIAALVLLWYFLFFRKKDELPKPAGEEEQHEEMATKDFVHETVKSKVALQLRKLNTLQVRSLDHNNQNAVARAFEDSFKEYERIS